MKVFRFQLLILIFASGFVSSSLALAPESSLRPDEEIPTINAPVKLYSYNVIHPNEAKPGDFDVFQKTVTFVPRAVDVERIYRLAGHATRLQGNMKPTIVSVGAGSFFLEALLAQKGVKVIGVEPNENVVRQAAEVFGLLETAPGSKIFVSKNPSFDLVAIVGDAGNARNKLAEVKGIQVTAYPEEIEKRERFFYRKLIQFIERLNDFFLIDDEDPGWGNQKAKIEKEYVRLYRKYYELVRQKKEFIRDHPVSVNLVLNSWMPQGIDFRQSLDDVGALYEVLIEENGGSTGLDSSKDIFSGIDFDIQFGLDPREEEAVDYLAETIPLPGTLRQGVFGYSYFSTERYQYVSGWNTSNNSNVNVFVLRDNPETATLTAKTISKNEKLTGNPYPWEYRAFWTRNPVKYLLDYRPAHHLRFLFQRFAAVKARYGPSPYTFFAQLKRWFRSTDRYWNPTPQLLVESSL